MSVSSASGTAAVAVATGPLVAEAAARHIRAPVQLVGADAHGWPVASRRGDTLFLDEYGDLWWARTEGRGTARVIRACWPEEAVVLLPAVVEAMRGALAGPRLG